MVIGRSITGPEERVKAVFEPTLFALVTHAELSTLLA
jgi:hypothetical protein